MEICAVRLTPGSALKTGILEAVKTSNFQAGFILTAVGSVSSAVIRLADCKSPDHEPLLHINECCEIVSLVGTMSSINEELACHIHISLSKADGSVIGGHLMDATIHTTAEVVIGNAMNLQFTREVDADTGFKELVVTVSKQ